MTHQEIDRRLALAIGYPADRVRNIHGFLQVWNHYGRDIYYQWQRFDHTDPAVIWPIAERFGKFPDRHIGGGFCCYFWSDGKTTATHRVFSYSPVAATATALAVIKHVESKA